MSSGFSPIKRQYSPLSAAQDQSINGCPFGIQARVPGDLVLGGPKLAPRTININFNYGTETSDSWSWSKFLGAASARFIFGGGLTTLLSGLLGKKTVLTQPGVLAQAQNGNYSGILNTGSSIFGSGFAPASHSGFYIDTFFPGTVIGGAALPAASTTTGTTGTTTTGTTGTTTTGTTGTTTTGTTGTTTTGTTGTTTTGTTGTTTTGTTGTTTTDNGNGTVISANDFNNAIDDLAADGKTEKLYYGVAQNKEHDYQKTISKHGSGVDKDIQKKGIRAGKANDVVGKENKTKADGGYYQYITLTDGTSENEYTYTFKSAKDGKLTYKLSKNDSDVTHDDQGGSKGYELTGAEPEVVISIKDGAIYLESTGVPYSSTTKGKKFTNN